MKETYQDAIAKVFIDEGGYSNDPSDPGGPTNWGITLQDARLYWKPTATADDVRHMPKSVAEEIYQKHYAIPLRYDDLPAGVDYAVLDYGINSGVGRSAIVLQRLLKVSPDGQVGPATLAAASSAKQEDLINALFDERLRFYQTLSIWPQFGRGWTNRINSGRSLALALVKKYPKKVPTVTTSVPVIVAGGGVAAAAPAHWMPWIIGGTIALVVLTSIIIYAYNKRKQNAASKQSVDLAKVSGTLDTGHVDKLPEPADKTSTGVQN